VDGTGMILEKLCELAHREELLADPDYEPKVLDRVSRGGLMLRYQ
jgi:hypothetical protein